jgi:TPR repeat protein
MSSNDAAPTISTSAEQCDEDYDDVACPLCHEEFPKLDWRGSGRHRYLCCGKCLCDNCESGLPRTYWHNAQQEAARRGVPPTVDHIIEICKEKVECPFCRSPVRVSDAERVRRAQALADRGNPWALTMLGTFHRDGIGTEKNESFALECFRKVAEMGYTMSHHYLGECYLFGFGTSIDVDEAAVWFERAAATGFAPAQRYLGNILGGYAGPSSIPIDHERAFELYADAAEQGYGPAQADLATAYESGLGVAPSLELSISWERKASMQGVVEAQRNLAGTYLRLGLTNDGVPVTAPVALFWARKAAAAADGDAFANLILHQMEHLTSNKCWCCSAPGSTLHSRLLRCSRCKEGRYCTVEHQKKHWKLHKRWCDEAKAASEEYEKAQKHTGK